MIRLVQIIIRLYIVGVESNYSEKMGFDKKGGDERSLDLLRSDRIEQNETK
jgi:hypothetical protein